ncbi:MAG: glycosyltransferase [Planctomycetales bacterium]|nr:glycosyltransferase [Planctomycetales bacterium]
MSTEFADSLAESGHLTGFPVALPPQSPPNATPRRVGSPPRTRKILHIINGEHYSGAERVQDLLAAGLRDFSYDMGFACIKPGRFAECRQDRKSPLFDCPMKSRFDLRILRKLGRIVVEEGYELLHAHTPRSLLIGRLVAAQQGLPLVYHVHSPTSRDSTRAWVNRFNAMTENWSLSNVSRIITVSESLAAHMRQQGFDSQLISVVPNGVPRVEHRKRVAPSTGPWTLGTVALFRPRKGTEILLQAIAHLRDQGIAVKLRAVGGFETADYESYLKQLTSDLNLNDTVDWVGFQKDVNQQLEQIDLFVLPSLFGEGMPMVVLESMAMGIPVVSTYVEGVPEVIRDGIDGRLATPGDSSELASAIASIVEGDFDWASLSRSVSERHDLRYSDRSMAAGVASVYDGILRVRQPDPVTEHAR